MTPPCGSGKCEHAVANGVLYRIGLDMLTGTVPVTVRTFAELHDHVDANDYFTETAGSVPFRCDAECERCPACEQYQAYFELVNAAQELAARIVDAGLIQRRAISQLC